MKLINRFMPAVMILLATSTAKAQAPCDTINGYICRSIVTDTAFNPYVTGVLGNWRANKSYTYFTNRAETDPAAATNIRRHGTFGDFNTFWAFQANTLVAQPDTTRWIWNSELTLFNRKGFEIENKDPLGRYNAGLYGYNLTLPTAVIQNSRYRESAFEGFEDYGFVTQVCDTGCATGRHFDFTPYVSKMVADQKHTGKSSLRLLAGEQVGISVVLQPAAADTVTPKLNYFMKADVCVPGALESIKTTNKILLPTFSPIPGRRMVISIWVKEEQDCSCTAFTKNRLVVLFNNDSASAFRFAPSGNIIEGWQRYENTFEVPGNATSMTVSMEATGNTTVYFDDLRIHPFNANMKSFVYHPVNLRLMAELDENNYASLFEYDDDGTMIRLKKETQRGLKTLKESRSALLKQ